MSCFFKDPGTAVGVFTHEISVVKYRNPGGWAADLATVEISEKEYAATTMEAESGTDTYIL